MVDQVRAYLTIDFWEKVGAVTVVGGWAGDRQLLRVYSERVERRNEKERDRKSYAHGSRAACEREEAMRRWPSRCWVTSKKPVSAQGSIPLGSTVMDSPRTMRVCKWEECCFRAVSIVGSPPRPSCSDGWILTVGHGATGPRRDVCGCGGGRRVCGDVSARWWPAEPWPRWWGTRRHRRRRPWRGWRPVNKP